MADLSTNYMDDILAESMNGKRKYRITRADGSFEEVTLEDISEYEQRGSVFGAGDINRTNQAVNEKFDSGDVVDPMETTVPGFAADALAVKNQFNEQNKKFGNGVLTYNAETDYFGMINPITQEWENVFRAYFGRVAIGCFTDYSVKTGTITMDDNLIFSRFKYVMFVLCYAAPSNRNFYGTLYDTPTIGTTLTSSHSSSGKTTTNSIQIYSDTTIISSGSAGNSSWQYGVNAIILGNNKEDVKAKANEITEIVQLYDYSTK